MTKQILEGALARIEKSKNWGQHVAARDAFGVEVDPWHPSACKFCAYGAIRGVVDDASEHDQMWEAIRKLAVAMGSSRAVDPTLASSGVCDVFAYNDTHSHADVVARFQEAINACG